MGCGFSKTKSINDEIREIERATNNIVKNKKDKEIKTIYSSFYIVTMWG